jgi:hypothetical protein
MGVIEMRFFAFIRKELRECLPWFLLAVIFLLVFGSISLYSVSLRKELSYPYISLDPDVPQTPVYQLTRGGTLSAAAPFLLITVVGLGLCLGIRQFWYPHFTKVWDFELHRSVNRKRILFSKMIVALPAFIFSAGLLWYIFYWYAGHRELFMVSPPLRHLTEGWIITALGFIVYLGTVKSGLSEARWYTTKLFGLGFSLFIIVVAFSQYKIGWAIAAIIAGVVVFMVDIMDTFESKEF